MDRDVDSVERSVYNTLMLLGDVGGLYGIFVSFAATILGVLNYQKFDNLLVGDLYRKKNHVKPDKHGLSSKSQNSLREYLQSCLPKCFKAAGCLKQRKEDKLFEKARDRLASELDVVRIL